MKIRMIKMGRPCKHNSNVNELIAKSNRLWCQRKSSYEPTHRYAGTPSSVRWEDIKRPRIKQEQNLNDYSKYR